MARTSCQIGGNRGDQPAHCSSQSVLLAPNRVGRGRESGVPEVAGLFRPESDDDDGAIDEGRRFGGGHSVSLQQEGGHTLRCSAFFHCRSSQGQFIRRHDHIRDALHDMIGVAVRNDTPYDIAVTIKPLVRLISAPDLPVSAPDPQRRNLTPLLWIRTISRTSPASIVLT